LILLPFQKVTRPVLPLSWSFARSGAPLAGGGSNSKARSASLIGLRQQIDQHKQLLMTKCSGAIMILFYEASPEANKE